jgi:tetratricopeptide (TPR) repeat protein
MKRHLGFLAIFMFVSALCLTASAVGLVKNAFAEESPPKTADQDKLAAYQKGAETLLGADTLRGKKVSAITVVEEAVEEIAKDVEKAAQEKKLDIPAGINPTKVIAQAREDVRLAKQYDDLYRQELKAVQTARNWAEAQYHWEKAKSQKEMSQKIVARAHAALYSQPAAATTQGAPPVRGGLNLPSNWTSFEQLRIAAATSVAGDVPRREEWSKKIESVAFGEGKSYHSDTGTIVTREGISIDVRVLDKAYRNTRFFNQPFFVSGSTDISRAVSASAQEWLASPEFQRQKREVGGVDLQVSIDMLSILRVSGFAKVGPATIVDSPVLISLRQLFNEAKANADAGTWKALPERLRYPGEVERLHGFVLDPKNEDVFLIGSRARSRQTRIDLDCLIVGFRAAWKEGMTPGVSLDPQPDDPGGPQYVRVLCTPRDSAFARIMLEADYAMKRIVLGEMKVDAPEFKTLPQVLGGKLFRGASRFWLFPIPMGADDIRISDSARSVIFESGVRLLTASRRAVDGHYEDYGKRDDACEQVADLFTASYDEFERSAQIEPRGIYVQLHALIDIVTVGKIMRDMGIEYSVLRNICNLPYARLELPSYYRGVHVSGVSGGHQWTIAGGVDVRTRAGDHSADWYRDSVTETLERAVDTFSRGREFTVSVPLKLVLTRPGGETAVTAENLRVAAQAALALKQYEAARVRFLEATKADPFYSDAFAGLAECCSQLGRQREAMEAIGKAMLLEPGNAGFKALALEIELRADPKLNLDDKDDSARQLLSAEHVERAFSELCHGRNDNAHKEADTAIQLWDGNADAFFARALTYADLTSDNANSDLLKAIGQYRKQARKGNDSEMNLRFARAMAVHASVRFARIQKIVAARGITEANVEQLLDESARAAEEAKDARLIYDSEPETIVNEILARAVKVELLKMTGQEGDITNARNLADQAVKRFPDFSPAHSARSYVLSVAGASDEAISEMGEAICLDPTKGSLFVQRAELYFEQHSFAEAKADLDRAKALGAKISPILEEKIRGRK